MNDQGRRRFHQTLRGKLPLRLHMFVILLATAFSGVLASKGLLALGLNRLAIRYPLAVLLAYLVFFLCVKLWLVYITSRRQSSGSHSADWLDVPDIPMSGLGDSHVPSFRGGGGHFSGGGATGSFDSSATTVIGHHASDVDSSSAGGLGDAAGDVAGALGSDEGGLAAIIVITVLVAFLVTILGSAAYIVYDAPAILSEAAFEGLLAASLVRGARSMGQGDWVGSIFSTTWKPFVITLLMALAAGITLNLLCPGATRVADLLGRS